MDHWEKEVSRYRTRLRALSSWDSNLRIPLDKLPTIPLNYSPSQEGIVAVQISLFTLSGCVPFTRRSVDTFKMLWNAGNFAMISLPARLIMELWGSAHFGLQAFEKMVKTGDIPKGMSVSQRLLTGARSEVELPWGGIANEKSIHVMDCIRSLADILPEAEDRYNFLCESCHPSFLRLSMWSLAGLSGNWTNPAFQKHAHKLLDSTLTSVEKAVSGIVVDTNRLIDLASPIMEEDQREPSG